MNRHEVECVLMYAPLYTTSAIMRTIPYKKAETYLIVRGI